MRASIPIRYRQRSRRRFRPRPPGPPEYATGAKTPSAPSRGNATRSAIIGFGEAIVGYYGAYDLTFMNQTPAVGSIFGDQVSILPCCDKFPGSGGVIDHVNALVAQSDIVRSLLTYDCMNTGTGLPLLSATTNPPGVAVQFLSAQNVIAWDQTQVNAAVATDGQTEIGILYNILAEINLVDVQAGIVAQLPDTGQLTAQYGDATVTWNADITGVTSFVHAMAHNSIVQNLNSDSSGALEYALSHVVSVAGSIPPGRTTQFTNFSGFNIESGAPPYCGCDGSSTAVTADASTRRAGANAAASAHALPSAHGRGSVARITATVTKHPAARRRTLGAIGNWPNLNGYNPYGLEW
jgi:hypothetical protein